MIKVEQYLKAMICRKNLKRYNILNLLSCVIYVLLCFLILKNSLELDLKNSNTRYFTLEGLRQIFVDISIFSGIYLLVLLSIKKLNFNHAIMTIIILGIVLRICYSLYTGVGTRTHDVYREWGHLDYIKYVQEKHSLPPFNNCQAYHPPVHHIISAIALDYGKKLYKDEFYQLKLVQFVMAIMSCITLILIYGILRCSGFSSVSTCLGVGLFAFHPSIVFFASKINNDNTMLFFYVLAFYFLIRWINKNSILYILLLSISTSLAILTKKSAIMLLVPIAAAYLVSIIKNRNTYKKYLGQFSLFILITVPLSASHQIRNYLLFNQGFDYVPSLGQGFIPSIYNLFYIPLGNFIKTPFNKGGLEGGEYFFEFLLKSSLFGEWEYPGLEKLGSALIAAAIISIILFIFILIYLKKDVFRNSGYVFLLNLIVPFASEVKFRTYYPVACSQDFRYMVPIMISAAYFIARGFDKLLKSDTRVLKYASALSFVVFYVLGAIFIMSVGSYN